MKKNYIFGCFVTFLTFLGCTASDSQKSNKTISENAPKNTAITPPDVVFGKLFEVVQMTKIFPDGKTFPDCTPKFSVEEILKKYADSEKKTDFNLQKFILENFDLPTSAAKNYETNHAESTEKHIESLWDVLTRDGYNLEINQSAKYTTSLLAVPKNYVVPGGRFREIYYWDSFFTMLGLRASGRIDVMENMVTNFAYLIDRFGHIPNGTRSYYLSRSQPPFFSLMVRLLDESSPAKTPNERAIVRFLPQMERELAFWMDGSTSTGDNPRAQRRVIFPENGVILNRYFDDTDTPRAESYREDVETAQKSGRPAAEMYRNLKAGAESGWDFSARWLADGKNLSTIRTIELAPVDLNCLLFHLEKTIGEGYEILKNTEKATLFSRNAQQRRDFILEYFWNKESGFFEDFDWKTQKFTEIKSLAGVFPLYFGIASLEQSASVAKILEKDFLQPGGLVSTLQTTGQQWDAPNGWAPLQWIAVRGLERNGQQKLAANIKKRWLAVNDNVYKNTGKMMEKYRVDDISLPTGGGEYPVQDGFGWSNGVYLDFYKFKYLND
jgi:alpha,alpha-trehalase